MHVQKLIFAWNTHQQIDGNTKRNTTPLNLTELQYFELFLFGVCVCVRFFRKCVLPEGLAREPPKTMKISKRLDLIGYTMVSTSFICKSGAKTFTSSFKHVPGVF